MIRSQDLPTDLSSYAVGGLSFDSACKVALYRGQLAGRLRTKNLSCPGAMMSVNLQPDDAYDYLQRTGVPGVNDIKVACMNSPVNCTLSGDEKVLDLVRQKLDQKGIFCKKIKTGVAYHSPAMEVITLEYENLLGALEIGDERYHAQISMISSVTGRNIPISSVSNSQYWVQNLVSPVRFLESIQTLSQSMPEITDLVEVGPHPALRRPILDTLKDAGQVQTKGEIRYSSVLNRTQSDSQSVLKLVGSLFCHGHRVAIEAANQQDSSRESVPFLMDCPGYPFDHSKVYWNESRLSRDYRFRDSVSDLLGDRASDWNPMEPKWRNTLTIDSWPWVNDHVVRFALSTTIPVKSSYYNERILMRFRCPIRSFSLVWECCLWPWRQSAKQTP